MAKKLKPSVYYKGLKLSLVPKNKIDTVTIKPHKNVEIEEEVLNTTIESDEFSQYSSDRVSLGKSYDRMYGYCPVSAEAGRSIVHVIYMHFVKRFEINKPVSSISSIKISLSGTNVHTARHFNELTGESWGNFPAYNSNNIPWLRSWIDTHKDGDTVSWADSSDYVDYINDGVPMVPCVNRNLTNPTEAQSNVKWYENREGAETYTTMLGGDILNTFKNNYDSHSDSITTSHAKAYNGSVNLATSFLHIKKSVRIINPYLLEVDCWIPIGVTAVMVTRDGTEFLNGWGTAWVFDENDMSTKANSYIGFYEDTDMIMINITGTTLDTDTEEFGYSLNAQGDLTTTLKNNYPYDIEDIEFLSSNAMWGNELWRTKMLKYILTQYKDGKYITEASLPAEWCVDNALGINNDFVVVLQDGRIVKKDDRSRLFRVKTIEKKYEDSKFNYNIKLLEEDTYALISAGDIVYQFNPITVSYLTAQYLYVKTDGTTYVKSTVPAGNEMYPIGYKCVVCSTSTLASTVLLLPGKGRNSLFVAIKVTEGNADSIEIEKFSLYHLYNETEYASTTDIVKTLYNGATYIGAKLIKQNVPTGVCIKCTYSEQSIRLSLQVYTIESASYTSREALDYLIENEKLR